MGRVNVLRAWGPLGVFVLIVAGVFLFLDPIPQDPAYHDLADKRVVFGVPNFANVVSNLAFLAAGAAGMAWTLRHRHDRTRFWDAREEWPLLAVFIGTIFLAFASVNYHLDPANGTLAGDRLAIAMVAMPVLSLILMERVSGTLGLRLLPVLLAAGAGSVLYWISTEDAGAGDLRAYGIVQFLPALAIPALVALFPARYSGAPYWFAMLGAFALAKGFEVLDDEIWRLSGETVSGHTLKHLAAGGGLVLLALYLRNRRALH